MATQTQPWQFTVTDFARMADAGIFGEDDRVELLDGAIYKMSPIGPRHAAIVNRINAILSRQFGNRAIVSIQNPLQLTDYTEQQPDIAVLQPRDDFYASAHPLPPDVLLIVEVAETSIDFDREEKLPQYAQAAIPEVWLVDLNQDTITRYAQPDQGRYSSQQPFGRGQVLDSSVFPTLHLEVDQLLG